MLTVSTLEYTCTRKMYTNKDRNSRGPPGAPNSWGDPDVKYVDALYNIWTDAETKEITHRQTEFLEAFTRYHEFRNRTIKLDEELSDGDYTNRICEHPPGEIS